MSSLCLRLETRGKSRARAVALFGIAGRHLPAPCVFVWLLHSVPAADTECLQAQGCLELPAPVYDDVAVWHCGPDVCMAAPIMDAVCACCCDNSGSLCVLWLELASSC